MNNRAVISAVILAFAVLCSNVHGQLTYNNILIDSFANPVGVNLTEIRVSCGPDGVWCDTPVTAQLISTLTQIGPWPAGEEPLGGERYSVLVLDTKQPGFDAGSNDNVEVTYDQPNRLRIATSAGIGGTYTLLWNGPGNNVLPCISSMGNACPLDGLCCVGGGNPAGNLGATGSVDLTEDGTQLGIGIMQKTADHDSPLIIRIWGADGRSIVARNNLQADFTQRNILFLYKDFVPFSGDASPADVKTVLKNTRAIAFQIFGAIALDAKLTFIKTVGVQVSKELDAEYVNKAFFLPGDRVCWTAFVLNNAPPSIAPINKTDSNVLILKDVTFTDHQFVNSALKLDRSSIAVIPSRPGLPYDIHNNDPSVSGDYLKISLLEMLPGDNATIKFCADIRKDYIATNCTERFCNFANVQIPNFEADELPTQTTCINVKYEPLLGLSSQCPTDLKDTPRVIFIYSNTGKGPAENSKLRITITGTNPASLNGLPQNSDWTCSIDSANSMLICDKFIGKISAGSSGTTDFLLNLAGIGCECNNLVIHGLLTETCSNSSKETECSIPLMRSVKFELSKSDSYSGEGIKGGQTITYTISFRNAGDATAEGVFLIERYPEHTSPKTSANPGWICDTTIRECYYKVSGPLTPSSPLQTVQFSIVLDESLPLSLTQLCNTVIITNANSTTLDLCRNTESVEKCTPVIPGTADTGLLKRGIVGLLLYRITYFNNGTAAATNTILRESIPVGTIFVANESDPRWDCQASSCVLNLGTLAPGQRSSVLFAVKPIEDFTQTITDCWMNRVTIEHTSSVVDPSLLDNVDTLSLGNCNNTGPVKCPEQCPQCPTCQCHPPDCLCPKPECKCPTPKCSCPIKTCDCPAGVCKCPTPTPLICPDTTCKCDNPCPKIEECEEIPVECPLPSKH